MIKEIQNKRPFMTSLIFVVAFGLKTMSRTILLKYYYTFFIKGKSQILPWMNINKYTDLYDKEIKLTNFRFIFWVFIMVIIVILQFIRQGNNKLGDNNDPDFEYILVFFDFYCTEIPAIIGVFTLSLIYLELQFFLKNMNKLFTNNQLGGINLAGKAESSVNFGDIMKQYKAKYDAFSEINHWFNCIISMKICANLYWFWINFSSFKGNANIYASVLYSIWNSIIIIEFVYTGNKVTNVYNILKNNVNTYRLFTDINDINYNDYLYFCNIISNYALNATFMESIVSIRNTVVFIAIFLFFKFAEHDLF